MNRRTFLRNSAGVAALGLGVSSFQTMVQAADKKKIPIGVQLYSVRAAATRDLASVLKAVKAMDYDGVEFAGYYGIDPKDIRKMLDDNGLQCCGTHTGLAALIGSENLSKTVEIHKTLGTRFIIVPGGIDEALSTRQGNEVTAYLF
ncbi:MAG: hypothetical protein FWH27_15280, partial [Planctomycetaceae bacterium]|nr:hypothetical protein [Planctomycetaceae bacterium]